MSYEPLTIERTVSAPVLIAYYDRYADTYGNDYPKVANPPALMEGIAKVAREMGDGELPDRLLLYVLEDEDDKLVPQHANYLIMLKTDDDFDRNVDTLPSGFQIRLIYTKTNELESLSTIEEKQVVWSSDNLQNTQHINRTRYYLGFAYMLCNKSEGFDAVPVPEKEMTAAELLGALAEGEIPADLINISLPEENEVSTEEEQGETVQLAHDERETGSLFESDFEEMEEDDTEVIVAAPESYEDEYDDLETDYEELFD